MKGDLVPFDVPEKDLRDEVNSRTAKAGYTNRYGEQLYSTKIQTIIPFGKQKLNVWKRNKRGHLI